MNEDLERLKALADKFKDFGLGVYVEPVFPKLFQTKYQVSIYRGIQNIGQETGGNFVGDYQECLHYLDVLKGVANAAMCQGEYNILQLHREFE